MKKIYIILSVMLIGALSSFAQSTGDYRSTGGNWSVLASWQRFTAPATWATPTAGQGYPGQNSIPGVVTILDNDAITLDVSPANHIGSLVLQTGSNNTSLTFGATTLIVDGNTNIQVGTDNTSNKTLAVGAGTFTTGTLTMDNTAFGDDPSTLSISTGSVTVNGAITMAGSNTENFITFSSTGTLNVSGNVTGGTITAGTGTVNYNGTTQDIGAYSYNKLSVSGSGTKTLTASTTVASTLTLNAGFLSIPTGMVLTLSTPTVIAGSPFSSAKHIITQVNTTTGAQGFLRVNAIAPSTSYLFPVGDGTNYLPATLNLSAATVVGNNSFNVCAFPGITTNGTPNGTAFSQAHKDKVVNAVWAINYNGAGSPNQAAGNTGITVAWPATLEGYIFAAAPNALIGIAHYGPSWGTAVGSGDNAANTATRTAVTSFSPFAVGGIDPGGAPLAIQVGYFNASKGNTVNTLNWSAACNSAQATFEIERSADGRNFTAINSITASQARCALPFTYDDASPLAGTNFYRIKIIDVDGRVSYTSIVKVGAQQKDMVLAAVLPNPVSNIAQLNITTSKKDKVELAVVSLEGKVVYNTTVSLQSGSSIVSIDATNFAKGAYIIRGVFTDGQVSSVKFMKQ